MAWGWGWLESLVQDVRFALRQLWKTPGFTVTAILTLALGIGANAAIFTLVKAVMLKNLPVVDPKALVRVGDRADCCQNSGPNLDGEYSMFSTDTYEQMKRSTPEFEELAAMQAGFENRPVVIRRDGGQEAAKPRMGEFISGNYFRMFGLQPATGRLLSDTDDVAGAPLVAVMSYATWKDVYNGDDSVVGSTFWMNTKAMTVVGVAPEGFYGDRMSSTPPDFYLPIATMPDEAGGKSMRDPSAELAGHYWAGEAGGCAGSVAGEVERATQARVRDEAGLFSRGYRKDAFSADCRWCGHAVDAGELCLEPEAADMDRRAGADDCVREHCQPSAGAWDAAEDGDECADGIGRDAYEDCSAVADGEPAAGGNRRHGGPGGFVRRSTDVADAGVSGRSACADQFQPFDRGAVFRVVCGDGDRRAVWLGSGADRCQGSARGCLAQRDTDNDGWGFTAATRAGGAAGGVVGCAAGGRGAIFAKPGQAAAYGHEAGIEEPLYRPYQRTGGGL